MRRCLPSAAFQARHGNGQCQFGAGPPRHCSCADYGRETWRRKRFTRAVERGSTGEFSLCLHLYPEISRYVTNPYATDVNFSIHLATLKDHAIELARAHAVAELEGADELDAEGQAERSRRRRQKAIRLLFRLAPGRSGAIGAIRCGG